MAEVEITDLTVLTSVDRAADYLEIADASDSNNSKKASVNSLLDLASHPVGLTDTQTLTNKTLTAPTISDPMLSGTITGTYTLAGTPTFPSAVVTLTGSQTLTNKTLTSPTINTATISNPTLTTDTISEHTGAAGVTIDGVLLKDSKMNGSYLTADSVPATAIDFASDSGDANGGIWWEEIGRTTLGVAGDTITVSSIPARKYLKVIVNLFATGGTISGALRVNSDSGSNYAYRYSDNGGADTSAVSQTSLAVADAAAASASNRFAVAYISNVAAQEKAIISSSMRLGTAGAGNAVAKTEITGKWANTSDQITTIAVINGGTGDFAIGSEVVVLGHD